MRDSSQKRRRDIRSLVGAVLVAGAVVGAAVAPLHAQAPPAAPNQGALTFTGGVDVPTVYFFRGILQEGDPALTLWPFGNLRVALASGDGGLKSVAVDIGVWNSLHTGTAGSGGPLKKLHYQEDFHATLDLGLSHGVGLATTYLARTSPNGGFNTIKELDLKVSKTGAIAPYGLVAFELSDTGQADGGAKRGVYLELGVAPSVALHVARARLTVPAKVGVSLKNYYELFGSDRTYRDNAFGFFDIGGLITIPVSSSASRFGAWNVHGGAELITLGVTPQAFNRGERSRIIGLVGVGLAY